VAAKRLQHENLLLKQQRLLVNQKVMHLWSALS
jgi:hypothetical protein